jgi:hypothetical protein
MPVSPGGRRRRGRRGPSRRDLPGETRPRIARRPIASAVPPAQSTADSDRLRTREYIGYALGDTASNFFFQTFNIFLTYYYVDVWGIPATALLWLIPLVRAFGAFDDVIMGLIADRTHTRWGKFRPYLLFGALPYGICGYLMFAGPDLGPNGKLIYAAITYALMMVSYTVINVPYSAMLGVISPSPRTRTVASTCRFVGAFGAAFLISLFARPLVKHLGAESELRGFQLRYSYVEMVPICAKLGVPRPPGGYWYRLAHGGGPEQMPLPAVEPGVPTEIELGNRARFEEQFGPEMKETPDVSPEAQRQHNEATRNERVGAEGALRPMPEPEVAREDKAVPEQKKNPAGKVVYTREGLYEAVWSTPCSALAKTLGLSDVGLAKTCKRLGIPRPTRGYWARVGAGQQVEKRRLPPAAEGQDRTLTFDVAVNTTRRDELAGAYITVRGLEELAVDLELPEEGAPLHRLAERHREALTKVQAGEDGLVHMRKKELFRCEVAPASIGRLCRALHALVEELEARGYKFRGGAGNYDTLRVVRKDDWVSLSCSEGLEHLEREPTEADKRRPSWTWQLKETKATGRFSFGVHAWGLKGRRAWTETDSRSLGEVLGIVVEKVDGVFQRLEEKRKYEADAEKRRAEQQELWERERIEEEKRRAEQEKQ